MLSKKDLQERFGISLNTVRKTLEACGLDTARCEYTEEEINERFDVARQMLTEQQKSYAEVADHFGATLLNLEKMDIPDNNAPPERGTPFSSSASLDDPLAARVEENVTQYVQDVVDQAMADAITHLPSIIYGAAQKLARSGAIDDAFQQMAARRRGVIHNTPRPYSVGGLPFVDSEEDTGDADVTFTRMD